MYLTYEQKLENIRRWAESGLKQDDFCAQEGISSRTFARWIKLAKDSGFLPAGKSLGSVAAKSEFISRFNQPSDTATVEKPFGSMVLVSRSRTESAVTPVLNERTPITVEYMGARILIDENSIESVFRALKTVSGFSL